MTTSIYDLQEQMVDLVSEFLSQEGVKTGSYSSCKAIPNFPIDLRAFSGTFWYSEDFVAIREGNRRAFDYYGGFEYVDKEYVTVLNGTVFYLGESDRVQELIDALMNFDLEE